MIIKSTPEQARWYINEGYQGETDATKKIRIEPGKYNVKINKMGYQDFTGEVIIKADEISEISIPLRVIQYGLTVNTTPSDAKVAIMNIKPRYYDGIKLKPGNYRAVQSKYYNKLIYVQVSC